MAVLSMTLFKLLFAALIFLGSAKANALVVMGEVPDFRPSNWSHGFHFLPGAGINTSIFDSKVQDTDTGWGGSIRMDIGYYFTNDFALELSSSVNVNRVNGYLIWDNQFNLGMRTRITFLKSTDNGAPYARAFIGRGPLVIVFEKSRPAEYAALGANRLQLEGPAYGGALGYMQMTSTNSVWFMELVIAYHQLENLEVIKTGDAAPVIVAKDRISERSTFSSLHLIIGMVAF
jgi:hypothetical protein